MQIYYGNLTLADDDAGDVAALDERGHARVVDEVTMFEAASPQTLALGNGRNTIGFLVDKLHGDADTAAAWLLDHPGSLPKQAALVIQVGGTLRRMADATLKEVRLIRIDGQSTLLHYSFTGGAIDVAGIG